MRNLLFLLLFLVSVGFADSALLLKKGWQLIGSTTQIKDMSIFDAKNVDQIWHFEASTQKWKGYSPDNATQQKISDKGFEKIDSLQSWHGFWIKSKRDWSLSFPSDIQNRDTNITLKKGWNLISLPVNSVVSPHIFDDATVWKYANNQWNFFNKDNNEEFPAISHISNSDGIWVKSKKNQTISTVDNSAKLHNFKNLKEMKAYIRDMLLTYRRPTCGYYPMISVMRTGVMEDTYASVGAETNEGSAKNAAPITSQSDNASKTNLQESGVDEADILKHNDTNIFYISKNPKDYNKMRVNITTFEQIANNQLKPLKIIDIDGYAEDMYLLNNRLVVISRNGSANYKTDMPTPDEKIIIQQGGDIASMKVEIFNVSDINNIQKIAKYKIDGSINSSRVVDGKLYFITNFNPTIQVSYPHKIYIDAPECKEFFGPHDESIPTHTEGGATTVSSSNEQNKIDDETSQNSKKQIMPPYYEKKKYSSCYGLEVDEDGRFFKYDYDRPEIKYENLIPYYQKNSEKKQMLISAKTLYASCKKDQQPTITTVSQIDITDAKLEKTSSIMGYNQTIYASTDALYMVSNIYPIFYNFDKYKNRSAIYKFSLGNDMGYKANGFINGHVLNQFNLSEYNDILRVATSEGNSWQNNTNNSLYTLKTIDNKLIIQGSLSGLGHEGETIHSVRFIADKGFIVTFKRTDPLYTLDLSDYTNPKKVGELKIDGFSSYLHPISDELMLGFGRDATQQGDIAELKIDLYNISDLTNPQKIDTYSFSKNNTYSEIEYNHKALAYRESDKLFAFPYRQNEIYGRILEKYLGVFQVKDNKIIVLNPLKSANSSGYLSYRTLQRGLIFDINNKTYISYFSDGFITYDLLENLKEN